MAVFPDLSNELVLETLQYVPLNDLGSACTITKCISLLAAPVLHEHRRLQDHYSVIYSAGAEDHPLARLLIRFFADPRIAHYIRSLTLVGWMDEWELDDVAEVPHLPKPRWTSTSRKTCNFSGQQRCYRRRSVSSV